MKETYKADECLLLSWILFIFGLDAAWSLQSILCKEVWKMIIWTTLTKAFGLVIFLLLFTITKETNYILGLDNILHNCRQLNILMTGICKEIANYPFLWKLQYLMFFQLLKFVKIFFKQKNIGYFLFIFLLVICLPWSEMYKRFGLSKKLHVENWFHVVWLSNRKSASNISALRNNFLMWQVYC